MRPSGRASSPPTLPRLRFNSLLEMPTINALLDVIKSLIKFQFSIGDAGDNPRNYKAEELCGGFNSLLEMHDQIRHVPEYVLWHVSILYWRCNDAWIKHDSGIEIRFNSLLEMQCRVVAL